MENKILQYTKYVDKIKDELTDISNKLWNYSETGFQENESSNLLVSMLKKYKFKINREIPSMPTAFVANYGEGKPVIAILGEYDALPNLSQEAEPKRKPIKKNGSGHGCGHNLLATGSLGAILMIKEALEREKIEGTIRYYGCPAEEIFNTKGYMIKPGDLFEDVDITLSWHPGIFNAAILSSCSAINSVIFKFTGKAAHAASEPHKGRSALDAIELMNIGANYMREHMIPQARIHYVIINGGKMPHKVPNYTEVYYSIRSPKRSQVNKIFERLKKIAKGAELMTGTEMEFEFLDGTYNHIRNETLSDLINNVMEKVGPPEFNKEEIEFAEEIKKTISEKNLETIKKAVPPYLLDLAKKILNQPLCPIIVPPIGKGNTSSGCSDVGDISWNTPLGEFRAVCFPMGVSNHTWQATAASGMSIGHKGMIFAAKVIGITALILFKNHDLVEKAKRELKVKLNGKKYISPFPKGFKPPLNRLENLIVR